MSLVTCKKCKRYFPVEMIDAAGICPRCDPNNTTFTEQPMLPKLNTDISEALNQLKKYFTIRIIDGASTTHTSDKHKPTADPITVANNLVPCRVCEKKIATDAATCPHCGTSKPALTEKQFVNKNSADGCLTIISIFAGIFAVVYILITFLSAMR
jgi:RNA polymerase subunit RPABC4/transcription elongation factor Spt4